MKDIKKFIAKNSIQIVPREKNVKFMREHGLLLEDVKEIIMSLTPQDHVGGPEKDENDKYEGDVWKFKNSTYLDTVIYIKIRYNPPKELVCISFHQDEV